MKELLDKRDSLRTEELIAAIAKSQRTYEEILKYITADEYESGKE